MSGILSRASKTVAVIALLGLGACSGMTDTQQKTVSGATAGMAIGAVGTVITGGCVACGTAIGGVVGAGTGYLLDQLDKGTRSDSSSDYSSGSHSGSGY